MAVNQSTDDKKKSKNAPPVRNAADRRGHLDVVVRRLAGAFATSERPPSHEEQLKRRADLRQKIENFGGVVI